MPEVFLKRVPFGLVPADPAAEEAIKAVPVGSVVRLNLKGKVRNYGHHKKWWALMELVAENWPNGHVTREQVCEKVKLGIDHFDWLDAKLPGSEKVVKIPITRSISFGKMSQEEFNDFYDKGVRFIRENLWPSLTDEEIKRQVEEFAG